MATRKERYGGKLWQYKEEKRTEWRKIKKDVESGLPR